ncbi:LysE family translocator [Cystobacter fuscus]|nr:LysE family translocator [Cystobacter fuscus]
MLVMTPGADWAYAIASGLRDRSVLPAVTGMMLAYFAMTLAVAAGVGAVVADNPLALTLLTAAGAAYLVWMGLATLRSQSVAVASAEALPATAWWARLLKGVGISGTNPKAFLLFLALLPQFTAPDEGWSLARQLAVLGLVHTLNCGAVYLGVGVAARAVLRTRPIVARAVTRASGVAMTALGALMLVERLM